MLQKKFNLFVIFFRFHFVYFLNGFRTVKTDKQMFRLVCKKSEHC